MFLPTALTHLIPQAPTVHIPLTNQALTARLVLTAVLIIQSLALKLAELGMAQLALCPVLPVAPLLITVALVLTAVLIIQSLALKLAEFGMEALAKCQTRAVQAVLPKIPPPPVGYWGK